MLGAAELDELRAALEQLLPESLQIINCLVLCCSPDGHMKTVLTSPVSRPAELAVVVVDRTESPKEIVSMFSTEQGEQNLRQILEQQLDWGLEIDFNGLTEGQIRLLQEIHGDHADWIYQECHVHSLWPSSQLLIPPRPPPSFSLAPLSPSHAPLLAGAWKFADERTVSMVERQVRLGRVLGLFPPDNTNPVAWMQIYSFGALGMLWVEPGYRRQGLASYLVSQLVEQAGQAGLLPYVHIEDDNTLSQTVMSRLGFTQAEPAVWVIHKAGGKAPGGKHI